MLLARKALFAAIVVMFDHRVTLQASLSCGLLVAAYIVHQRLQAFVTSQPLSSRLNLTSEEMQAVLSREESLDSVRKGDWQAPCRLFVRLRRRTTTGPPAERTGGDHYHSPHLWNRITCTFARIITRSFSVVIDYNQLVRFLCA